MKNPKGKPTYAFLCTKKELKKDARELQTLRIRTQDDGIKAKGLKYVYPTVCWTLSILILLL